MSALVFWFLVATPTTMYMESSYEVFKDEHSCSMRAADLNKPEIRPGTAVYLCKPVALSSNLSWPEMIASGKVSEIEAFTNGGTDPRFAKGHCGGNSDPRCK